MVNHQNGLKSLVGFHKALFWAPSFLYYMSMTFISNEILKCKLFADDAKLYKDLQNLEDFEMIQDDLDKLCQWTINWLLFYNAEKCKVLHIGRDNPKFEYELTDKDKYKNFRPC